MWMERRGECEGEVFYHFKFCDVKFACGVFFQSEMWTVIQS